MIGQITGSIIFIVLFTFLFWLEFRRKQKANLLIRTLAVFFMLGSLYCIILPPSWNSKETVRGGEIALLTDGYINDSLLNLKNIPIYTTIKGRKTSKGIPYIPDLSVFLKKHPDVRTLHVLGIGLDKNDLASLKDHRMKFVQGEIPGGIQSITWSKTLIEGQQFKVTGKYINKSRSQEKVILRVFGTTVDSLDIGAGDTSEFSLKNFPKHIGNAVYELLILAGRDTLSSNPIPVQVSPKEKLRILVLANSPGFEIRFLKDWLVEENHSLAVRTRISRDKFSNYFAGINTVPLNSLSVAMLNRFDLVIADHAELSAMSINQQQTLFSSIQNGLGMLISKTSNENNTSLFRNSFPTRSEPIPASRTLSFELEDEKMSKALATTSELLSVPNTPGSRAMMKLAKGKFMAGNKLLGEGRLTISTLPDSYQWKLKGQDEPYGKYWSYLIQNTARKNEVEEELLVTEQFPTISTQIPIQFSSQEKAPQLEFENEQVRLSQNSLFANRWHGHIWTSSPGWKDVKISDSINHAVYIYDSEDWNGIKEIKTTQNNIRFAANQENFSTTTEDRLVLVKKTIPSVIFYVIFLLCCGFLWLEPKIL